MRVSAVQIRLCPFRDGPPLAAHQLQGLPTGSPVRTNTLTTMTTTDADLALDARCLLAEGPVWHDGSLWFVDIEGRALHRFQPDGGGHDRWETPGMIGFAVPTDAGDWIAGQDACVARWRPGEGVPRTVAQVEPASAGTRMNDAKADPAGRLFAGTLEMGERVGAAALYRFDSALRPAPVVGSVRISNGLAWDVTRAAMYYIDTPTRRIDRFDWDAQSGEVGGRRDVYSFPEDQGFPDGMCIDEDGRLWVGLWDGGRVACIDPERGEEVASVRVAAARVTSCCFGGSDLEQLWITTARTGLDETALKHTPGAGGIFVARPGVRGSGVTLAKVSGP